MGNEQACCSEPVVNKPLNPQIPIKKQEETVQQHSFITPIEQKQQPIQTDKDLPDQSQHFQLYQSDLKIEKPAILNALKELNPFEQDHHSYVDIKTLKTFQIRTQQGTQIYQGQWENKKKKGYGKCLNEDGSYYEGYFFENQPYGKGIKIEIDGSFYIGAFYFGFAHGKGHKKTLLEEDDQSASFGQTQFKKQIYQIYDGDFINNKMHGKGKQIKEEKYIYEGDFINDMIEGHGECLWGNGKRYIGQWQHNNMHGKGEFYYSDDKFYKGSFKQNKFDGYGEMHWPGGSLYKGEWTDGEMNGKGALITEEQEVFEGEFEKGTLKQDQSQSYEQQYQ